MPSQAYALSELVARFGGSIVGDAATLIKQVGTLGQAGPDRISFYTNPRYRAQLRATRAGAVILAADCVGLAPCSCIVADAPYAYFARVSQFLNTAPVVVPGISPHARVASSADISIEARIDGGAQVEHGACVGPRSWIGAGCYVGADARIGSDVRMHPSVTVLDRCIVGDRCILHSGAVIGADGFGIARDGEQWLKIPQIGRVVLGCDIEVGANTAIDRGAMEDTLIEDGVKLDNHIQIGHNARIGAHTAMAGCVAVAGSADIGRHCTVGAAAVILGHLTIADGTSISAGTVISRSIRKPGTYTGIHPFDENVDWARNSVWLRHLAKLAARVEMLEDRLGIKRRKHG